MKNKIISLGTFTWLAAAGLGATNQPSPGISVNGDAANLDWTGQAGRTYFVQCSVNLVDWIYMPVVELGASEPISYTATSSSDRLFFRLKYTDQPVTGPVEEMDFDGDGLGSLFEVRHGYDPFLDDTDGNFILDGAEDGDLDGSINSEEMTLGRHPAVQDHPAVKLSVVVGN